MSQAPSKPIEPTRSTAAAGKALTIPTRFERSCKALWNLVERG
jgi:hypothetical protein